MMSHDTILQISEAVTAALELASSKNGAVAIRCLAGTKQQDRKVTEDKQKHRASEQTFVADQR